MTNIKAEAKIPLNYRDREALTAMFEKMEIEEIRQIEAITYGSPKAIASRRVIIPLEPWEEQGWIVNSSCRLREQTI